MAPRSRTAALDLSAVRRHVARRRSAGLRALAAVRAGAGLRLLLGQQVARAARPGSRRLLHRPHPGALPRACAGRGERALPRARHALRARQLLRLAPAGRPRDVHRLLARARHRPLHAGGLPAKAFAPRARARHAAGLAALQRRLLPLPRLLPPPLPARLRAVRGGGSRPGGSAAPRVRSCARLSPAPRRRVPRARHRARRLQAVGRRGLLPWHRAQGVVAPRDPVGRAGQRPAADPHLALGLAAARGAREPVGSPRIQRLLVARAAGAGRAGGRRVRPLRPRARAHGRRLARAARRALSRGWRSASPWASSRASRP